MVNITKDVELDNNVIYTILKLNGEECLVIKDSNKVLHILESIVDKEASSLKKRYPNDKILTEIDRDRKTANIYIQKSGYVFNGSPTRICKFETSQIPLANIFSSSSIL